jgi:hypothetical protein
MQRIRGLVFLVAPRQRQLYESLTRTFADDDTVQVILDRRASDRRKRPEPPPADRRRKERRRHADVQQKLSLRGYAVVGVVAAKPPRRS